MNSASVIGEGSYGCVHKPRLECSNSTTKKRDKRLTKFMLTKEALKELTEYTIISHIDKKKQYYLGKPSKCTPKMTKYNLNSVRKCDLYKDNEGRTRKTYKKNKKNSLSSYSLLVIPDGGMDMSKFADSFSHDSFSSKQRKLDMFWKHASHMLKGIALFQKHGILHHDVKPQNIVFNMKNEHIRFIDFGFMEKINSIKQKCIKNKHYIASYPFWSYPFEFPYLNKEKYMHIAERSVEDKREYFRSLVEKRMNDSSSKIAISCHVFFDFILRNHSESEKEKMIEKYFNDFMNFIVYEMKPENYDTFLDKSIRTIDLFGVGITMQLMLSYSMDYFDSMKYAALEECIFNMMRPSLMHRYTIEEAMVELMKIMDSDSLSFDSKEVPFHKKLDKKTSNKWVMDQEDLLEGTN